MMRKNNIEDGDIMKKESFKESITFKLGEGVINEAHRTVRVCALASCVSRNGRYYSPAIVESSHGTLKGKGSFADHDERDTKNLIGKIVNESYSNGKLYADIKISKAKGIASQTWDKLKEGIIDSVSIAADGEQRPMKLGEDIVSEVTALTIHSVDFVTEGGVPDAKVTRVFENVTDIPEITEITEVKKDMTIENKEQLVEQFPDLVAEILKEKDAQIATLTTEKETAEFKLVEKELAEFKSEEIGKLKVTEEVTKILSTRVSGKTKEEVSASLKQEHELVELITKATQKEARIEGVVGTKKEEKKSEEPEAWTSTRVVEDTKIPAEYKEEAKSVLLYQGSKAMLEYLEGRGVKL